MLTPVSLLLQILLAAAPMFRVLDTVVLPLHRTATSEAVGAVKKGPCLDHPDVPVNKICVICGDPTILRTTSVLAGFKSSFAPGAGPAPCDRLTWMLSQGVFTFHTTGLAETVRANFHSAILAITRFDDAGGPISVNRKSVWTPRRGAPASRADRPDTECVFDVKTAAAPWTPAPLGITDVRTRELSLPTVRTVTVPLAGEPRGYNVTPEIRAALLRNADPVGFVIQPAAGQADHYAANNHCAGRFTVELRVLFERR